MINQDTQRWLNQNMRDIESHVMGDLSKAHEATLRQYVRDIPTKDYTHCDVHDKGEGEHPGCRRYCDEAFRQLDGNIKNVAWDLNEHKSGFEELQSYIDGVGRMINPLNAHINALKMDIKRLQDHEAQVEALKIDVKRLQDTDNDSFESVASDSPEKRKDK